MKRLFAAAAVAAMFATPAHAITVVTARPVVITPRVSVPVARPVVTPRPAYTAPRPVPRKTVPTAQPTQPSLAPVIAATTIMHNGHREDARCRLPKAKRPANLRCPVEVR